MQVAQGDQQGRHYSKESSLTVILRGQVDKHVVTGCKQFKFQHLLHSVFKGPVHNAQAGSQFLQIKSAESG